MAENTLSVGRIKEGFVLDHIQAGKSMEWKSLKDFAAVKVFLLLLM